MTRVLVADDNPVVRAGLTALLDGRGGTEVVAEAADGREACEAALLHRPDVVLLDVRMPGVDGLAALPRLVRVAPVMMLTYSGEAETVREALRLGARGYLVHGEFTVEQLVGAVRDVGAGGVGPVGCAALPPGVMPRSISLNPNEEASRMQPDVGQSSPGRRRETPVLRKGLGVHRLSRREVEVMELIAAGMSNQQIAAACFISEKTVKNHINRIFAKLHSNSRTQAVVTWLGARGAAG
ncbi:response regulator transcription factor [Streptomyces sp. BPTC-684]|uniref:response regulator transcription factor n=1 Tax=Streptomyces sp. BPTC-684 TaxID=3043734 RepID=UPI0024B1B017|nr:response regulator transcription factor [Streptomyces sp. BPTC-684]WHM36873.1 response regulator transcription factor [Streptomyces sp. BPTC-684]